MKIYFYDGEILNAPLPINRLNLIFIDAGKGPHYVLATLDEYKKQKNVWIVSNSILALSHEYGWNEISNHTDIYIYSPKADKYIRIDKLTDKEIRRAHNIGKMYIAGTFNT